MSTLPSMDSKASSNGTMTLREAILSRDLLVVDARSADEYRSGHYDGAKNIPVGEFDSRFAEMGADLKRPIIIHCMRGMRAGTCQDIAQSHGYVNVFRASNADEVKQAISSIRQ